MIKKLFLATLSVLTLGACASIEVDAYRSEKPQLDLRRYFNGTLDERFTWSDGTTSRRVWTLKDQGGGRYIGTADDVVGEARGEASGNALRWRYVLALPVDGKTVEVDFDDWMFLMDEQVMLNRSVMSKYGYTLGEVTLSFRKRP